MGNEAMGVSAMKWSCSFVRDAMHCFYVPFGQNHLGVLMMWTFTPHWVQWFKKDLKPQPMPFIGLSILLPLKVRRVSIQVALCLWHACVTSVLKVSVAAFCFLFVCLVGCIGSKHLCEPPLCTLDAFFLLFWGARACGVKCSLCKRCQHLPQRWIQAWHLLVCIKPD